MKERYLMIAENGEIFKSSKVTEGDKESCDSGILDIIDTESGTTYHSGVWYDLKEWEGG